MDSSLTQTRKSRPKESYSSLIKPLVAGEGTHTLLAFAPSDQGVIRNGGRLGARWAPAALLAQLQKFALPADPKPVHWANLTQQSLEEEDFVAGQVAEAVALRSHWKNFQRLIHIGGGHDHILPLLRVAGTQHPLVVINIDAHCDTRAEAEPHSGNPFRLFAQESAHGFQLHQIGIHPFANSQSTLSELPKGDMTLLLREDCEDRSHVMAYLARVLASVPDEARLVFSLDCDALALSEVGAVSAPNHRGLSAEFVHALVGWYENWCSEQGQRPYYGVYEFNPLYDSVSGHSARVMAGLLYSMLGPN